MSTDRVNVGSQMQLQLGSSFCANDVILISVSYARNFRFAKEVLG